MSKTKKKADEKIRSNVNRSIENIVFDPKYRRDGNARTVLSLVYGEIETRTRPAEVTKSAIPDSPVT